MRASEIITATDPATGRTLSKRVFKRQRFFCVLQRSEAEPELLLAFTYESEARRQCHEAVKRDYAAAYVVPAKVR